MFLLLSELDYRFELFKLKINAIEIYANKTTMTMLTYLST